MGRVLVLVAALAALAGSAFADESPQDLKWSQRPDDTPNGYDFSSETLVPSVVADDFQCNDARPITDVHWWGSYWTVSPLDWNSDHYTDPSFPAAGQNPAMPNIVTGFTITFYSDIAAGVDPQMPYSHPGEVILSQDVDMSQVAWNLYGIIDRDGNGTLGDDGDEAVWQYLVYLPQVFDQEVGNIYWLSIVAHNDSTVENPDTVQWGWHESLDHWNDNAVQHGPASWGIEYENTVWVNLAPKDMAFELSVPEPATMALLGFGTAAMFLGRRRRAAKK